jgi:uncharacterized membrane protein
MCLSRKFTLLLMTFEPSIWSNLHGASTHFPIALMLVSAFCDGASLLARDAERRRGFRFAGTVTIVLGALASYAAVLSGLIVSRWQPLGHATLLRHHLFVWPAFGMMTGLAVWRVLAREETSRAPTRISLALMLVAAAVMSGAGYWGGELLNQG